MKKFIIFLTLFLSACSTSKKATTEHETSVIPPHEVIKLENGAELYYFPITAVPMFQVSVAFPAGPDSDPEGKSGLTAIMSTMVKRGTKGLDENSISMMLDDMAGNISETPTENWTIFTANGLNRESQGVLDLFYNVLSQPDFPEDVFERIKQNTMAGIEHLPESPDAIGFRVANLILHNGSHDARPSQGLLKDVGSITIQDVKDRYLSVVRPDKMKILVIGGASKQDVLEKVITKFSKWNTAGSAKESKEKKWFFKKWDYSSDKVIVVDRPGVQQSEVLLMRMTPGRKSPEIYALKLIETILSGTQEGRLNVVLREEQALVYDVSSSFQFSDKNGDFTINGSTSTANTVKFLKELRVTIADLFGDKAPTEDELNRAKQVVVGRYPFLLENAYTLAVNFFGLALGGVSPDFYDAYRGKLREVSLKDFKVVMQKHLKFPYLTVVVGDGKIIADQLKKAAVPYVKVKPDQFL